MGQVSQYGGGLSYCEVAMGQHLGEYLSIVYLLQLYTLIYLFMVYISTVMFFLAKDLKNMVVTVVNLPSHLEYFFFLHIFLPMLMCKESKQC